MSTLARGKSTSGLGGVNEEILVPLIARLGTIDTFLPKPESSRGPGVPSPAAEVEKSIYSEARALLEKIQRELAHLHDAFCRFYETEKAIRLSFDPVERHIDDVLRGPQGVEAIHSKLLAVDAEIHTIKSKIRQAYNCNLPGEEEPVAPVSSHGPSAVVRKRMEETQRGTQMRHLRQVVSGLEKRMRDCVLCLAAFPADAVIKRRLLIHWWIGEEFVASADEGKKRFMELIDRGLIVPLPRAHCDKIHHCKVRPWMRDLLTGVVRSNGFLEPDSVNFASARRTILGSGKVVSGFNPEVRTIYNIHEKYVKLDEGWFAEKKKLRTLQLGQWKVFDTSKQIADPIDSHIEVSGTEHLAAMGKCKNLRYVSLRGISRIETLHDSIGMLNKLVVLDLRACHNLEELGQGITKLDQLEYLDLSECHLLVGMPKGLYRLTSLKVLKGFVIANSNCKDPCRLNDLTTLRSLTKISITIGKMAAPAVDEFKILCEFKALKSLTITWGVQSSLPHWEFTLPTDLKKLDLRGFPLTDFAQWVRPKHVKKLYIRGGKLMTLGDEDDWEVEVLCLRFLKYLHYDHSRLQHSFRKLKPDLTLVHECPNFSAQQ